VRRDGEARRDRGAAAPPSSFAECFGNGLMGHSNDGKKLGDRISIFKFYLNADIACGKSRLPLHTHKTHKRGLDEI
jgi:hypothetical protein